MTEEIIIDGVDVAGCIYYKQECIANCGMFALGDFKCEGQICLYKQLKRLDLTLTKYKSVLEEIREIVSDTCRKRCTNECLGTKKHCGYGKILNKINEVLQQ